MQDGPLSSTSLPSFAELWQTAVSFLPTLLYALLLLAAGWLLGRLLGWLSTRLMNRLGRLTAGRTVERELEASGLQRMTTRIVRGVVFWAVFLLFVAAAGEVLGLDVITRGLSRLVEYLPSVLAAALVVLAGIVLANVARRWVAGATRSAGVGYGELIGKLTRGTIWLVAGVVALDQLGIESTLLIFTVAILVATGLGSAALAFALGARGVVRDSITLHYLGQSYRIGDEVRVGEVRGRIVEFARTAVVLDTEDGRALVPAAEFRAQTSLLLRETGRS